MCGKRPKTPDSKVSAKVSIICLYSTIPNNIVCPWKKIQEKKTIFSDIIMPYDKKTTTII